MKLENALKLLRDDEGLAIERNQNRVEQFINNEHLIDIKNTRLTFDDICADDWELIS